MSRPDKDSQAALDTLVLALAAVPELTASAERIAFLRAQAHEAFLPLMPRMRCEQSFKPRAARLDALGMKSSDSKIDGQYDLVLLLPDRQRDQTQADLARGFDLLRPGGTLVVSLHNDWGAKRYEKLVQSVAGSTQMISKNHCRVFWATKTDALQETTLAQWRVHAPLRRVLEGRFWSRPGLFAWDHIDEGSQFLADLLPTDLKGHGADLGAGWGYLSDQVLRKCPDIDAIDLYEAERDALDAAKRNLGLIMVRVKQRMVWSDVAQGIDSRKYDFIVMNPPFHEGRLPDPRLGMKFIAAASAGLKPHGQLWLVANRQLPYEAIIAEAFGESRLVEQRGNYKVITATQPLMTKEKDPRRKRGWVERK